MTEHVLLGPFLTRTQAAQRARVFADEVRQRPDLLRIGGFRLEEAYFSFQFDSAGVRPDIGRVVQSMKTRFDDLTIADWLVRPNQALSGATPLNWLNSGGNCDIVVNAAVSCGPVVSAEEAPIAPSAIPPPEPSLQSAGRHVAVHRRRSRADATMKAVRSH